jgi:ketosteroid isomerase-like protein
VVGCRRRLAHGRSRRSPSRYRAGEPTPDCCAKTLNYETWDAENLVTGFGETLGFTVELERLTRHVDGKLEEMSLRATSIYRREDGAWKVIHRHGDSLITVEIDPEGRR